MKKFSLLVLSLALPAFAGAADSSSVGSRSAAGSVPAYSGNSSDAGGAGATSGSVSSDANAQSSNSGLSTTNAGATGASVNDGVIVSTPAAVGGAGDTSGSVYGQDSTTTNASGTHMSKHSAKRKHGKSAEKKGTDTTSQPTTGAGANSGTSSTANPQ